MKPLNELIQKQLPTTTGSANSETVRQHEYDCLLCQDQGYQGWKTPFAGYPLAQCTFCACERGKAVRAFWERKETETNQFVLNRLFAGAGIPAHFRDFTIDSLIARAGEDRGKQSAIDAVLQFTKGGVVLDPRSKRYKCGIVLSGAFGTGKTGLLTPALRHVVGEGKSGLWIEVYDFLSAVQQGYRSGDSDTKLTAAKESDVILLDDLGDVMRDRPETDDRRRLIYQLINHRHNHALPMLITTNCTALQLVQQFGTRTVERIVESCAWIEMGGRNLRQEVMPKADADEPKAVPGK